MATLFNFGLLGFPLGHSLSPQLHRAAFNSTCLKGEYRLYPIQSDQEDTDRQIEVLGDRIRSGEIDGLNVTIPYKQRVIGLLDRLTPIAAAIEAVNTIFLEQGRLVGDNTDVPGFLEDISTRITSNYLGSENGNLPGTAFILGAGGSSRAIVYALAIRGYQIHLFSRRIEQATTLIQSLIGKASGIFQTELRARIMSYQEMSTAVKDHLGQRILIINTTPVGMSPDIEHSPWPEGLKFPPQAMIYDLIYNPRETLFIRQAKRSGLFACNGLGMLVEQAALSFEMWTGHSADRAMMWESVKRQDNELTYLDNQQ